MSALKRLDAGVFRVATVAMASIGAVLAVVGGLIGQPHLTLAGVVAIGGAWWVGNDKRPATPAGGVRRSHGHPEGQHHQRQEDGRLATTRPEGGHRVDVQPVRR